MLGDPPYYYVRDKGSAVAHHWDYLRSRTDHALCGHPYQGATWEGEDRPRAVCRACQAVLPRFDARWWRSRAEALQTEGASSQRQSEDLRKQISLLEKRITDQQNELRRLNQDLAARRRGSSADNSPGAATSKIKVKPRPSKRAMPDNTRDAVDRRLRDGAGPLSAANIPPRVTRPVGAVTVVPGGLPSHGRRR
jgi:hypothetical protein